MVMAKPDKCSARVHAAWEARKEDLQLIRALTIIGENSYYELRDISDTPTGRAQPEGLSDEQRRVLANIAAAEAIGGAAAIYQYGLGFDYVPFDEDARHGDFLRWQLGWGGPSDELQFYVTRDHKLRRAEYQFTDWFDGAAITLTAGSAELARFFYTWFDDAGMVTVALEEA
jgi:hypothetical protein